MKLEHVMYTVCFIIRTMYWSLLLTVYHSTLTDLSKFEYFVILRLWFVTAFFFKMTPLYVCSLMSCHYTDYATSLPERHYKLRLLLLLLWYTRPRKCPLMLWYSLQNGTMSIQSACFNQPTNSYSPNQCLCFAVFYLQCCKHLQSLHNQTTHKIL